jgi:hypothetical protein
MFADLDLTGVIVLLLLIWCVLSQIDLEREWQEKHKRERDNIGQGNISPSNDHQSPLS